MSPIKLFYSYSQKDEEYRDELEKSLIMLKRYNDLHEWHFRQIAPGQEWDSKINEKLESADIILLLVSSDFLVSEYCYDIEVKKAVEMHEAGKATVVPVILRECDWKHENSPFKKLQALPKNGKPIKQWDDRDTAFNDVTQRLKETIQEIKQRRQDNFNKDANVRNEEIEVGDLKKKDQSDHIEALGQAFKLINQEINKLDYDSSKEDFEEVQKLRAKLYDEIIGKLDEKIENIPALKDNVVITLFDKIYVAEKLDMITIQDIQNIRDRKDSHNWHERKVIINSLTLSLISSKKFDPKKVNILIDFLTDFEENVWESALIGLVISLVYHQNKWSRFNDLKMRLQTLQEISRVQDGLGVIEVIFRYNLYTKNTFNSNIYKMPFFSTPLNCFLPFYEGNQILESSVQNNDTSIDSDDFVSYLNDLPFLDSHKYALCLGLRSNSLEVRRLNIDEQVIMRECLKLSSNFTPYQNLICEYYNFLNYYPKGTIIDVFTKQFSITQTKLKSIILNKLNELELCADVLIDNEEFGEAVNKLDQLLRIDPNHVVANSRMAFCHIRKKKPDYYAALSHLNKIEKVEPNKLFTLLSTVECYLKLNNNSKAFEYIEKAKVEHFRNKDLLLLECLYYSNIDEYENMIGVARQGEEFHKLDYIFPFTIAEAYEELNDYKIALEYYLKALELSPTTYLGKVYRAISSSYCYNQNFKEALNYAKKAYELDNKDGWTLMTLGRAYLFGKFDLKLARQYLELALSKEQRAVMYGNLGHLEICEGNLIKSIEYYKKCILGFEDVKQFGVRFDRDKDLVSLYSISNEYYSDIKKQLIAFYNENGNK